MNFSSFLLVHLINFIISKTAISQPHLAGKDFLLLFGGCISKVTMLYYVDGCNVTCGAVNMMAILGHFCSGCQCYTVYDYTPLTTDRNLDPTTLVDQDSLNPVATKAGSITERPLQLEGPRRGIRGVG
ncbi:hypothetical protein E2542_SST03372 [Spatholobus suberectus]|nr:hypothetical protein E2542_SST03372 [Spatholobus suberectus]